MRVHELGHLVLYVRDLDRSRHFYREVLGWDEVRGDVPLPVPAAAFSSGRTHHELLLIEVGESDEELREVVRHLDRHGVPVLGASDHTVTHSLYIADPDGHEIELYVDVLPRDQWLADPSLIFAPIRPLRL
jgi:catechol 2,3-dioxygenase